MAVPLNVAVLMGGVSHERDVSIESGRVALRHLHGPAHVVRPVVIDRDGTLRIGRRVVEVTDLDRFDRDRGLPDGSPLLADVRAPVEAVAQLVRDGVDVAFLALHGAGGEDGSIQGLLEWAGVPYTSAGVSASVLALDKCAFKALIAQQGLPTAPHLSFTSRDWRDDHARILAAAIEKLGLPFVVKAGTLGSSFGVSVVKDAGEAKRAVDQAVEMSDRVLIESYIRGVELTCPVLGDFRGDELRALPLVEIVPKKGEFFDFESKYSAGGAEEICPARVPAEVAARMAALAIKVHILVGCEGVSRTDAILAADGGLFILETNTIPGMTQASLLPKSAAAYGWSLARLFAELTQLAVSRKLIYSRR